MKKRLRLLWALLSFVFFFNCGPLFAQVNVSVDNFTGTGIVNVPIWTVRSGPISVPISLVYSGAGVRVKDQEGSAGMNWHLVAGGEIRREVRGLPDDIPQNYGPNGRSGWLHNTNRNKVNDFSILNDNNASTCTDEESDLNYIATNFLGFSDTEPDIFYVNAPDLSCKMIFDKDLTIRTIPDIGAKITYTINSDYTPTITGFIITNDKGIRYEFSTIETTTRKTSTSQNVNDIVYFKHEFDQYFDGISYNSAWKLSSISDNGNTIWFSYNTSKATTSDMRLRMAFGIDTTITTPFSVRLTTTQRTLDRISYSGADGFNFVNKSIKFSYSNASTSSAALISGFIGKGVKATFGYTTVKTKETGSIKTKSFLTGFSVNGLKAADFDYYGVTGDVIDMPDSLSKEIDQWGFYNGSGATTLLPIVYINPNSSIERYRSVPPGINAASFPYQITGASRSTNSSKIINGSLKTITQYYGGTSTLFYEPNDYKDPTSGTIVQGGGVRVKQIVDNDGTGTTVNMVRNYSYNDPSTGQSSGLPISLPFLTFTRPYTGTGTTEEKWQKSTVRLEESISEQNNSIVYPYVKVSQTGAGSTSFEYTAPATSWQTSAAPDWTPTFVHLARPSCISSGLMTGQFNGYPFVPDIDFDFERGLLKKKTQYNENNEKVTESINTYARTAAPLIIQGLRFEIIGGATAYSKYNVFMQTGNRLVKAEDREYLPPSVTPSKTTIVENFYESPNHNLLTQQKTTNSDGSIMRSYIKYVKDYSAVTSSQETAKSINLLNLANANLSVENYLQLERNGVNKTLSGTLTKFRGILSTLGINTAVPDSKLTFISQDGLSNFQVSSISGTSFIYDSHYTVAEKYLQYSNSLLLVSTEDSRKNISTVLMNQNANAPVANIKNARGDEVYFEDFDIEDLTSFELPHSMYDSLDSRSGKYHKNLTADTVYNWADTRTIARNAIADNYIFSVWVKSRGGGNIILTLTNSSGTPYIFTLPYTFTDNRWKYLRLKLPMSGLTSAFTMKYKSTTDISIDDFLLYPEQAEINTVGYHPDTYMKVVETDGNGISQYYDYDGYKRLSHILDQDKNIILKKDYLKDPALAGIYAEINNGNVQTANVPISFDGTHLNDGNIDGMVFNWNFGDGHTYTTMNRSSFDYIYPRAGTYNVTLTKTSPFFSTATAAKTLTVNPGPVYLSWTYPEGVLGSLNRLDVYNGTTLAYAFLPTSFGPNPTSETPIITQAETQFRLSLTGSYNALHNPTGFKNIQVKMYNYLNELVQVLCVPYSTSPFMLNVNLAGVKRVEFSLITASCELMD